MFEKKVRIYIDDTEQAVIVKALINKRNDLLKQGRFTDALDELLVKVIELRRN